MNAIKLNIILFAKLLCYYKQHHSATLYIIRDLSRPEMGDSHCKDKDKDKDLFIGPQEFVVGYSKAPKQPLSSARPICHSHTMTRTGREPATICTAA